MAIVQAGKQFTATDIQTTAGTLATMLRDLASDGMQFRAQLETWVDTDLVALGLDAAEVNAIKGFFVGDLPAIHQAIVTSSWIKQLLGLGV